MTSEEIAALIKRKSGSHAWEAPGQERPLWEIALQLALQTDWLADWLGAITREIRVHNEREAKADSYRREYLDGISYLAGRLLGTLDRLAGAGSYALGFREGATGKNPLEGALGQHIDGWREGRTLRDALEWYAASHRPEDYLTDAGERARRALGGPSGGPAGGPGPQDKWAVQKSFSGWIIINGEYPRLAWSGSRWVPVTARGTSPFTQICNFDSRETAEEYASFYIGPPAGPQSPAEASGGAGEGPPPESDDDDKGAK
jgi:hypothetical protein